MSDPNYYFTSRISALLLDLSPQELQKIYRITQLLVAFRDQHPKLLDETHRFVYERTQPNAETNNLQRK